MTSYTKLINDLTRVVKLIPIKGLTKELIDNWKYFSLDGSQNYFVFQQFSSYLTSKNDEVRSWQSTECQKKVLNLYLQEILVLIQK